MFLNYLKVTVRSFVNQKYYSIINTLGLALGLAACIMILLFVQDELSYEKSFTGHDKIYRLVQDFPMGDHLSQSASVPFPTKNAMAADFPAISNTALAYRPSSWGNPTLIRYEEDEYYEDDFIFAEHSFLEIFNFNFMKGNPAKALLGPNELIITESVAKKYFGTDDPIGKRLNLNSLRDLEVVGVIEELPHNTHLHFNMLCSFETFKSFFNNPAFFDTQWVWVAAWMYFTVENPDDVARIRSQLPQFVKNHYPASLSDKGVALHIQKADDIHLHSDLELEFKANGNIQHVYIFSSIAFLILIIAVINFMNLATSRSAKRGKEVGLRKVMGAKKEMLVTQFMGEALLTTFLSLLIAIFIIYHILPWYNNITGKSITINLFQNPLLLGGLLMLLVFVGLISGSYPSLIISSFNPAEVLKGKVIKTNTGGELLRKSLVISQFVVSISLIICIGIVYKQLKYIHTLDLGFDKEQIVLADINFNQFNKYASFKNTLENNSDIRAVTRMGGSIPGQEELIENAFVESGTPVDDQQWFSMFFAAHDFEKVLNIDFIDGHSFQIGNAVDSAGFIINESTARALGWGDDVIGRSLDRINSVNGNIIQTGTVIGLVKDYHYRPLYDPIKPLVIGLANGGAKLCIKMHTKDIKKTLAFVEENWNNTFDGTPFRYSFMDKDYDKLYEKEEKMSRVIQYFSILAIFIACLGLLGLSSFTTEHRKKEIGIRKVNGASTIELLTLLTKDFSKLIVLAFVIAIPVSYYFGSLWLNDFAYRTSIGIDVFLVAGVSALLIALLTVSYHTIRAAMKNPVNSIRYE
ncbi:MAG: ABC transporter permease [Cytophagales bacterium]|nr:ABC transporter permease [Cytophagales bacterium]